MARAFIDTNVLVYSVDTGEPAKRRTARRILREAESGELVLSAQVLAEFYVVVTRKLAVPLSGSTASSAVDRLSELEVVAIDADLVRSAVALSRAAQISYWDASIVRAAISAGCDVILSEDLKHGQVYDGVRVDNPFA